MSSSDSTPANDNYFKAEEIIGKTVVSSDAETIGTVRGLALSVGGKAGLQIARNNPTGTTDDFLTISSDEILAVGDVVLIKTSSANAGRGVSSEQSSAITTPPVLTPPLYPGAPRQQGKPCPRCGYLNGASSRFCIKCGGSLLM
ncbi:MAG: PRC-barrel domain-containing protein [Rhabdochlamydiaceae bacterium]